ncbi:MAG TPA: MoxR family ATPase [Spirochaetia bacterium]|nr:MoxR family ATPase [Spirochaetia bacterium]
MAESAKAKQLTIRLGEQIGSVFVGSDKIVHNLLIGFFGGLHVLIEDIPGVGKTTLAMSLARSTGLDFGRIQFTPDILPGDILGMTVWSVEKHDFLFKAGAIMHQFVLADEINRASARTQSSLLEAMQEEKVTIDGTTHRLPQPFFVIATQNPISFTGTFLLPESQADRFGLSFSIGYPETDNEVKILERFRESNPIDRLEPVADASEIIALRREVGTIHVERSVMDYLVRVAAGTRDNPKIKLGMSPRSTQHLLKAAQSEAMLNGRDFVIPEDVLAVAPLVIPHRLVLSGEARMENMSAVAIVEEILSKIPMPTGI